MQQRGVPSAILYPHWDLTTRSSLVEQCTGLKERLSACPVYLNRLWDSQLLDHGKWRLPLWFSFPESKFAFLFLFFFRETACVCVSLFMSIHSPGEQSYGPFYRCSNDSCDYCRRQWIRMCGVVFAWNCVCAHVCKRTLDWFTDVKPCLAFLLYIQWLHDEYLRNRHRRE